LFRLLLLKNIASPRINNDERLSGHCCAKPARPQGEREDDGKQSVGNHKAALNGCTLFDAFGLATPIPPRTAVAARKIIPAS